MDRLNLPWQWGCTTGKPERSGEKPIYVAAKSGHQRDGTINKSVVTFITFYGEDHRLD